MDFSILKNMFPNMTDEELQSKAAELSSKEQAPDYTSLARESVMNKYGIGKYSPEERQKLVDKVAEANSPILSAISGFGAGLRGQDNMAAAQKFNEMAQAKAKEGLAAFDQGRKTSMEDYKFGREMTKDEREDKEYAEAKDPKSARSQAAQKILVEDFGFDPATVGNMTAEMVQARIPTLKDKIDRETRLSESQRDREFRALREREFGERQKDRELQREIAMNQKEQARADRLEKEGRLSEKQVGQVSEFDNALDSIKSIRGLKTTQDTGPLSNMQNKLAGMVGMDDAEKSAFRAQVQDQLAMYIKGISGGAVSDQERAFLIQNLPTMNDNDETFNKKLDVLEKRLERNRENFLNNAEKAGKNTKEFARRGQAGSTSSSTIKTSAKDLP